MFLSNRKSAFLINQKKAVLIKTEKAYFSYQTEKSTFLINQKSAFIIKNHKNCFHNPKKDVLIIRKGIFHINRKKHFCNISQAI